MHKMCSDDLKCAVMKGCLCSNKKGHSEICLDKQIFGGKIRSFRNFTLEMCILFSLKQALLYFNWNSLSLRLKHRSKETFLIFKKARFLTSLIILTFLFSTLQNI